MFTSEGIVYLTLILLNYDQKEIFQNILPNHPIFLLFVVFAIEKKLWKPSLTWLLYSYTIIQYEAYRLIFGVRQVDDAWKSHVD